ncbi:MAG TPA: type II secretion system F family protein [Candidatus Binatia bacterium]|nr:type II secretion system F family protein [Candidatus Binatia bacterium]
MKKRAIHRLIIMPFFVLMWILVLVNDALLFFITIGIFSGIILYTIDKPKLAKQILEFFKPAKLFFYNFLSSYLSTDLKITKVSQDMALNLVKPVANLKPLAHLQKKISKSIETDIRISGLAANPRLLGLQSTSYMILAGVISIPVAILFSIVFENPVLLFVLILVPAIMFAFPTLRLKATASERKSQIEDELAFFAAYCGIMQSVGRSLLSSLLEIAGAGIFKMLERESKMIQRNVRIFAMDELSAINNLALNHPNYTFSNFLLGYVSIHKSGGSLARYLENKGEEFFNSMRFRMSQYSSQAATIGEAMLIMLNVLPVLLISSSFMMPASSVQMLTNASFVLVPLIAVIMILVTNHSQPKLRDEVKFSKNSIFAAAISAAIGIISGLESWQVLVLGVFAGSLVNSIMTFQKFREISLVESALPDFLRDITEHVKIGAAIPNSIVRISKERRYNDYFDFLISDISSKIVFGYKLSEIISSYKISSWNARLVFFVLGKIADSGGGRPQTLEYITNFVTKVNQAKKEMVSSIRVFAIMAYSSPLMMVWMTKAMGEVMERLGPSFQVLSGGAGQIIFLSATPEFLGIINLLVAISAICMGMVMSKVASFTLKNTMGITITAAITFVSIYFSPYLPSMSPLLGGS